MTLLLICDRCEVRITPTVTANKLDIFKGERSDVNARYRHYCDPCIRFVENILDNMGGEDD